MASFLLFAEAVLFVGLVAVVAVEASRLLVLIELFAAVRLLVVAVVFLRLEVVVATLS